MTRQTHTNAALPVSKQTYDEIAALLRKAAYDHVFDGNSIDMNGIALVYVGKEKITDVGETFKKALETPSRESLFEEISSILNYFVKAIDVIDKGRYIGSSVTYENYVSKPYTPVSPFRIKTVNYSIVRAKHKKGSKSEDSAVHVSTDTLLIIEVYTDHAVVHKSYESSKGQVKCEDTEQLVRALADVLADPFFKVLL